MSFGGATLAKFHSYHPSDCHASGRKMLALVSLLITLCVLAYSRVHSLPYFNVDDGSYVFANIHVTGPLNWGTVRWAFTHTFALNYDPLAFLAHSIDVRLFQTNPAGHHVVNLFLHTLNVVLLFWVLYRATDFSGRSFMVAALFAVHPVNVENVAWISELKTLLSTAFFLVALGAYGWYVRRPARTRMLAVATFYGMALLAKPQAITFPFALLLWDYWPLCRFGAGAKDQDHPPPGRERSFRELVKEKTLLFVIAAGDAVITSVAEHKGNQPYTFPLRLGNAMVCYVRYAGKAFWPLHLAYLYPHPGYGLQWLSVWIALAILVAVTALVLRFRAIRYLPVGWFWFLGTLFPMIGLVQIDAPAMADRYAYLAYIGLFIVVCWSISDWALANQLPKRIVPALSISALILLTLLTWIQTGYWKDSIVMWKHSDAISKNNWVAEQVLATLFQEQGKYDDAIRYFLLAMHKHPNDVSMSLRAAYLEQQRGYYADAIHHYRIVLALSDDNPLKVQVWANMGHAYGALGEVEQERSCYRNAQLIHLPPPAPPDRDVINWKGEWWNDLGPYTRRRLHSLKLDILTWFGH